MTITKLSSVITFWNPNLLKLFGLPVSDSEPYFLVKEGSKNVDLWVTSFEYNVGGPCI